MISVRLKKIISKHNKIPGTYFNTGRKIKATNALSATV